MEEADVSKAVNELFKKPNKKNSCDHGKIPHNEESTKTSSSIGIADKGDTAGTHPGVHNKCGEVCKRIS